MVKRTRKLTNTAWAPRASADRPNPSDSDIRSARLAQRVHPDLLEVYDQRSREYGLTRSQLIERVLIDHANAVEGAQLDSIGRWLHGEAWGVHKFMRRRVVHPVSDIPLEIDARKKAEHEALRDAIEDEQARYAEERYRNQPSVRPKKK